MKTHSLALLDVERICKKHKVPVEHVNDGLRIIAIGKYKNVRYPFFVSEYKEGGMYASLQLQVASVPVEKAGDLAQLFSQVFEDIAVYFEEEEKRFQLSIDFEPEKTHERLSRFLAACDVAFPVLTQVSNQGSWDARLVNLALYDEDRFGQA